MSYDLMVFEITKAPKTKKEFMAWYDKITEWEEEHDYETVSVTSPALQNWFMKMKETFPPMNGEFALTAKAKNLEQDYKAVSDKMSEIFYKGFSDEEIRNCEAMLVRILDNMKKLG